MRSTLNFTSISLRVPRAAGYVLAFLLLGASMTAQVTSPGCKSASVSACSSRCGDSGECIFGCEIGQFTSTDECNFDCNGLGSECLSSCLWTVGTINTVCPLIPTSYKTVKVDGIAMGDALDGKSGASVTPTITFAGTGPGNGEFHMWYRKAFNLDAAQTRSRQSPQLITPRRWTA